jgi:PleD family two-component response regulator
MNAESTNDISVSSAQAVEPELQTPAKPDPVNILLVDDKPENLAVLESILERDDYRLTKAQSAQEALVALINTDFCTYRAGCPDARDQRL